MLLDTFAWIEVVRGTPKGQKVNELLRSHSCYTSAISLAELSAWIEKERVARIPAINAVKTSSTILDMDHELLEKAGILKIQKRKQFSDFGLTDAIILATAKKYSFAVVTGDKHFQGENTVFL